MKKITSIILLIALLINPLFSRADNILVIVGGKLVEAEAIVDPKVEIIGDETPVELGDFATLSIKVNDSAEKFIQDKKTNWKITQNGNPKRFFIDFQGNPVVTAGIQNGVKIDVEADTQITYKVEEKTVVRNVVSKGTLRVGEDKPTPPPPPSPPQPIVIPDGFLGATKANYNFFKEQVGVTLATLDKNIAKNAKMALRDNFYMVAAKLAAGAINGTDLDDYTMKVIEELKNANRSTPQIQAINENLGTYGLVLRKYLFDSYSTGQLKTVNDGAQFLRALGDAFNYD